MGLRMEKEWLLPHILWGPFSSLSRRMLQWSTVVDAAVVHSGRMLQWSTVVVWGERNRESGNPPIQELMPSDGYPWRIFCPGTS